jgi:hypothetical protein
MTHEEYVNNGMWELSDIPLILGACHSPGLDPLMVEFRNAQQAVADDEPRVRRLPRPWLGDPFHRQLKRQCDTARGRVLTYLLQHKDLIVIHGH